MANTTANWQQHNNHQIPSRHFPHHENGKTCWLKWEQVEHVFDSINLDKLKNEFKGKKFITNEWYEEGLKLLKIYYKQANPSNIGDAKRVPKVYMAYGHALAPNTEKYLGESLQSMHDRHSIWRLRHQIDFANVIAEIQYLNIEIQYLNIEVS